MSNDFTTVLDVDEFLQPWMSPVAVPIHASGKDFDDAIDDDFDVEDFDDDFDDEFSEEDDFEDDLPDKMDADDLDRV